MPEASEYRSRLCDLRGVVNAGFRNAGAGEFDFARKEFMGLEEAI